MNSQSVPNGLLAWFQQTRGQSDMKVESISLDDCRPWRLSEFELSRPDGRFFAVRRRDNKLYVDQPEIGLLSFVVFLQDDEPFIVVQAKDEPGNVGITQLAPTVQATLSNYSQVHGGLPTRYFDLANPDLTTGQVISDGKHSEHGTRFWRKRNRNAVVVAPTEVTVSERYYAAPVRELLELMTTDFAVNTDARSVLVTSDWNQLLSNGTDAFARMSSEWSKRLATSFGKTSEQLAHALDVLATQRRRAGQIDSSAEPLTPEQLTTPDHHLDFVRVTSTTREVEQWNQPLYALDGVSATDRQVLLCRNVGDSVEFLVRAKAEPGLLGAVEFAPTISGDTDAPRVQASLQQWLSRTEEAAEVVVEVEQSDEGGRFNQAACRYAILRIAEDSANSPGNEQLAGSGFVWVNLSTLHALVARAETTTNELRSVVSLLLYWL